MTDHTESIKYAVEEYSFLNTLPITEDDVAAVPRFGSSHGPGDEDYFMAALVRLHDGRFAAVEGGYGCYTGWSCQASLHVTVHDTELDAWLNITLDGRSMIERAERPTLRSV